MDNKAIPTLAWQDHGATISAFKNRSGAIHAKSATLTFSVMATYAGADYERFYIPIKVWSKVKIQSDKEGNQLHRGVHLSGT